MKNIGWVLKRVRDSKGLKTSYVYEGILSRSMFYKFEHGVSDISLSHFLAISDRLNIAFSELEGWVDYHDGYKENLSILMNLHYIGDIVALSDHSKKLEDSFREKGLIYYKHLSVLSKLIISYVNSEPFNEHDVNLIKDYLFNSEIWMYYELSLFTNSLFIFDLDIIDVLFKKVYSSLKNIVSGNSDIFMLVANILSLCFQKNDLNRIRFYIKILNSLSNKNDLMFSQFLKKFYTSLYGFIAMGEKNMKMKYNYIYPILIR